MCWRLLAALFWLPFLAFLAELFCTAFSQEHIVAKSVWKTTRTAPRRANVNWPSLGQLVLQLGLAIIIGVIWLGALLAYLGLVGRQAGASSAPEPDSVVVERTPTASPISGPTATPSPVPTSTPSPSEEPPSTPSNPPDTSEPVLIDPSPTATATVTPLPSPTPTETLQPATDTPTPAADPAKAEVSFSQDVFPIIERRCVKCHGGPKDDGTLRIEEGLKMTSYADIMAGSWNGFVLEPGSAEDSYLVEQIVSGEMPKKEPRLLPGEVRLISAWIDAGAPDN
jgi:hypothetical protein